jgi:hypothetical protein
LYVTPVGLDTSSIPYRDKTFEIEFDFVSHRVVIRTSDGRDRFIALYPRSVADFYAEYMSALRSLDIEVSIRRTPVEFDDLTPFDEDHHHASYDREPVERFHRILISTHRAFEKFRAGFIGKCSPIHFFWGSFDLAVTRFSGRPAPERPGADSITREAYSHEVISCGFWPGDRKFRHAAFYSYLAPAVPEFKSEPVTPKTARWDDQLGLFVLPYDELLTTSSAEKTVIGFCQSTYDAAAKLAGWDRSLLERST